MQYVGRGVYLKDEVHISDVRVCISASRLYLTAKKWWVKLHYMKRIVSALTGKRAWFWHVGLVPLLMKAAGFKSSNKDAGDAITDLDRVCTWIGVRIQKAREEVANLLTIEEIPKHVAEIMRRDLQFSLSMLRAQHSPEEFSKEIFSELQKLNQEMTETRKEIADVKREFDRYGRDKNTLAAGFLQPC